MPTLVVVQADVHDEELLAEYSALARPTLAAYGAQPVALTNQAEVVEGQPLGLRTVILRFPGRAQALSWYRSAEYQAAAAVRQRAATSSIVLVDEL